MSNAVSLVWTCDRCGREQPGDYDPHRSDQPMPVQWTRLARFADGESAVESQADLCRDCSEALIDWLYHSSAVPA
ncbi:MAG: hypothetical protein LC798_21215 [Chloroflexi bacterium]|nr:hypothetical protein [Chloroflexota bacterium]